MEPSYSIRKRAREKPETGRTLKHKQRQVHFRQSPDCGQKDEWSSSDSSTAPGWTMLYACDLDVVCDA